MTDEFKSMQSEYESQSEIFMPLNAPLKVTASD